MQWIVSLTPENGSDPLAQLARPPAGAAIIEVRLDLFPGLDPVAAVAASPLPTLLTLRSGAEGGRGPADPDIRRRLLRSAFHAGPALLDLELRRDESLIREFGLSPENCILSFHDPSGVPEDLEDIASELLEKPASLAKLITFPSSLFELGRILDLFGKAHAAERRRLIAFGMGAVGLPSRFLSPLLGAPLGFACFSKGAAAAPGQKSVVEMEAVCGHLQGPPRTLFGVVGMDVTGSLSPALHAAAYRELGLPNLFLPFSVPDPEDLGVLFRPAGETLPDRIGLRAGGWAVTQPYKEIAADSADILAPRVRRCGAANTLILKTEHIIAENTDADGVTASLTAAGIDPAGMRAVIRGTGGAARGAAVGLISAGAGVFLYGRDPARTAEIAEEIGVGTAEQGLRADMLINATPLGVQPDDPLPFTAAEVEKAAVILDMVYTGTQTRLIETAASMGKTVIDGRMMLARQGMAQFAAFTGRIPPKEVMLDAVGRPRVS